MNENEIKYQQFSTYNQKRFNGKKFFVVLLIFVMLVGGILSGLYYLGHSQRAQEDLVGASPAPAENESPLPTSSASTVLSGGLSGTDSPDNERLPTSGAVGVDKSSLRIAVLNGSGTSGAARDVSEYLEELGYKIVSVGNADSFTYQNITVRVKKSKSDFASILRRDLQADSRFASVSASISDEITSDAEVIVGK